LSRSSAQLESALKFLAAGRPCGLHRIHVLRTVSNYDQQPRGMTAAESLAHRRIGTYSAYLPSLQAAYGVGHTIVEALLREWPGSPITKNKQRDRYSVAP